MLNTDKKTCRLIARLLKKHGVEMAVLSPGSRNAPLMVAMAREPGMNHVVIVDERCAGFYALGYAAVTGKPVAVVCTSGTALLNLAPAVAEAYYRAVPLIVVSADRPREWIDQDDSQTIRQDGTLDRIVKKSYDIPSTEGDAGVDWMANRLVNDAMLTAVDRRRGPVHINVRLDTPLGRMADTDAAEAPRAIDMIAGSTTITTAAARELAAALDSPAKVMIIAGFNAPDSRLNRALNRLASRPNVVVMTETVANLHGDSFISRIDTTLSIMDAEQKRALLPDLVITLGGALVSRHIKQYLRDYSPAEHWQVGYSHTTVDCFKALTRRVEMDPAEFMSRLAAIAPAAGAPASDYSDRWRAIARESIARHARYIERAPWSDLKAMSTILGAIPAGWNLQLSNGTPVRYSQLLDCSAFHRIDCNRGVSGIDGSTSTALGASAASPLTTLFITGDLSAQYDVGALLSGTLSPRFKMIVIVNGGGGIFRFVESTASLPERDSFFDAPACLPLRQIAEGIGARFFEADGETSLSECLARFCAENRRPAILAVTTPGDVSGRVLSDYFKV